MAFLRGRSIIYCVKYSAKPQETADSAAVVDRLVAGFERALERKEKLEEENPEWTDLQRGSSRLHSLLYQLTSVPEVASTMASLYVYRNEMAFYESHPASSLVLASALPVARGEVVTKNVNPYPDAGKHTCSSPYDDYLFRPLECENVSWYDYRACFYLKLIRKKQSRTVRDADAEENSSDDEAATSAESTILALDLETGHPKRTKYYATLHSVRAAVDIIGPGLPPEAQCAGDDEKTERFAMSSMLMFVPHRKCSDLKSNDSNQTWEQVWEEAKQNDKACQSGIAFIRFNEDRWRAICANRASSQAYYDDIKHKIDKLERGKLPEFDMERDDDSSSSDDDESSAEINDDGDMVLDFADQGDIGKAPPRPAQFDPSDVRLPGKATPPRVKVRTQNIHDLEDGFKQPPQVNTSADIEASSTTFPAPRELEVKEVCDLVDSGIAAVRRDSRSTTADENHRRLRDACLDPDQATGTVLVTVDPQ